MNNNPAEEQDKVTRLSIANMLYQGILGRDIDKTGIGIFSALLKDNDLNTSIKLLTQALIHSREFAITNIPKVIVNSQFSNIKKADSNKNRSDDILILQTSDSQKYIPIINASSKFNELFCKSKGIQYQKFIGLKRGAQPHHAMFNRIYLLKELLDEGFCGWVLYLDADAIIIDPEIDLKKHFANLRESGKSLQIHSVEGEGGRFWNVNTGVIAIDLSTPFSSKLINSWHLFYELLYQDHHYEDAMDFWDEIINDQNSLHTILMNIGEELVKEFCLVDKFLQQTLCKQFYRSGASVMPSEETILARAEQILQLGNQKYHL